MRLPHPGGRLSAAMLLVCGACCAQRGTIKNIDNTKNKEAKMTVTESNAPTVRRLYEEALNQRNTALLNELISEDYAGADGTKGVAAFEVPIMALLRAFPDAHWQVEAVISEGNKVAVTWVMRGTHSGPFQGIAPTGRTVATRGMGIYEFKDGKIAGIHMLTDRLGFLQELNVLPADPATLSEAKSYKGVRFIDKFFVPAAAREEFMERVRVNRAFIKDLPGFIDDVAYERTDEQGNLIFITVAVWQSEDAVKKAKQAVLAAYREEGFDPAAMFERLHITMDRGIYREVGGR